MKTSPRLIFYGMLIYILIGISCKKEEHYMNTGTITGYDLRDCICCGGLMINFNNDTLPYSGEFYLITNDPTELGINVNSVFPIYLKVDWVMDSVVCANRHIKITRFRKL